MTIKKEQTFMMVVGENDFKDSTVLIVGLGKYDKLKTKVLYNGCERV